MGANGFPGAGLSPLATFAFRMRFMAVAPLVSILNAILAWMPAPPDVPADVVQAMAPGLVHPGTWVMTRRDTQITWLIRFSSAWKELQNHKGRRWSPTPGR